MTTRPATIFIRRLELMMSIGIYPEEKTAPQRVILDVEAICALPAALQDDIAQTVSYEDFIETARRIAASRHFQLVESFCEELAAALLTDKRLSSLTIAAEKPDIFKGNPKAVGVRMTRPA